MRYLWRLPLRLDNRKLVPEILPRLFNDPDTAAASRVRTAMMQMKKIDIAALEAAFHTA